MPFGAPAVKVSQPRKPRRQYKLADGTRVPSVTQVLQVVAKPALIGWANRMGLRGIDSNTYRDEKAAIGTTAHLMVEHYLRGEVAPVDDEALRELALPGFRHFIRWHAAHEVTPLLLEASLVSEKHRYGGTIDIVAEVDGALELIDLKFTNRIYSDHFNQIAGYWSLLNEHGYRIERARVIRMDREEGGRTPIEEDTRDRSEIRAHWQVFKAALQLYRAQQETQGGRSSGKRKVEATSANNMQESQEAKD